MKWPAGYSAVPGGGGGGVATLYKPYRYVPPHQVGFLHRFGLTTGIHFAHFGLESGVVFKGTMGVYERISIPNGWERKRNMWIRNGFEVFFFAL